MPRAYLVSLSACLLLLPATALGQDAPPEEPVPEPAPAAPAEGTPAGGAEPDYSPSATAATNESWPTATSTAAPASTTSTLAPPAEDTETHGSAYEDPQETYFFLGGFYRHTWLPSWMTEIFVQRAPNVDNPQFGLEFSVRKDRFEIIYSGYYADFSAYGPFLGPDDAITEMEMIDSNLWAAMLGVTFLWSSGFSDWFAIEYGLGLGIGYVGGNLWRTEAYPTQGGGWAACQTPAAPNTAGTERPGQPFDATRDTLLTTVSDSCGAAITPGEITDADGDDGEHYGVKARKWTNGGSVPNLWFRAALQLSLRFKPAHGIVIRGDGGYDIFSGFFAGGALQIGF